MWNALWPHGICALLFITCALQALGAAQSTLPAPSITTISCLLMAEVAPGLRVARPCSPPMADFLFLRPLSPPPLSLQGDRQGGVQEGDGPDAVL